MQNNNYVYYKHNEEKKEPKSNYYYIRIVLASIWLVECIVMLGIVLSAMWYLEYGV